MRRVLSCARLVEGLALMAAVMSVTVGRGSCAVTCAQVYGALTPCISYLSSGGPVPKECCRGVRSILAAAGTAADRRAACGCLKTAAAGASGSYFGRAAAIPAACGVSVPFKISPSVDCSKIK